MVAPLTARKTWRTLEPLHGMIYFAPEATERYAHLGVKGRMGYFASRSAALGVVPAETVIATFFNFNPALVRRAVPAAWEVATPEQMVAARLEAADLALRRALGNQLASEELPRRHAWPGEPPRLPASDPRDGRCSRHTPHFRGRMSPTWFCGTPRPCCESSAVTPTSQR